MIFVGCRVAPSVLFFFLLQCFLLTSKEIHVRIIDYVKWALSEEWMVAYVWVTLVMDWQLIPIPLPLTQYQVGSISSPLQTHLDKCKKKRDGWSNNTYFVKKWITHTKMFCFITKEGETTQSLPPRIIKQASLCDNVGSLTAAFHYRHHKKLFAGAVFKMSFSVFTWLFKQITYQVANIFNFFRYAWLWAVQKINK